jgi:hypothetical protein
MDPTTTFRPKGEYVTRTIAGETILVPVRSGVAELDAVFTMNDVGSVIWEGVTGEKSIEEIVQDLTSVFDVSGEEALRDSEEFLTALLGRGLIEAVGG